MNDAADSPKLPLAALLAEARAELAREGPPPALPARAWLALARPQPAPPRWRGFRLGGLTAVLALVLLSVLLVVGGGPPAPAPAGPVFVGGAFVPLRALPPAGEAGAQPVWTVMTEMPRERLAQLGLPFDPGRAGELVRAELLLDRRGEVLAVRPLTLRPGRD
jgi:hypothetical protein